jgi:Cupredoxin-like domain
MAMNKNTGSTASGLRYAIVAAFIIIAFFASFSYAQSRNAGASTVTGVASASTSTAAAAGTAGTTGVAGAAGGTAAGGCCGGGGASSAPIAGTAQVTGGVQKISVDLSSGSYNPNVLNLQAGVPAEITFGQSSGCTGQVQSQQLGFAEDLTSGAKTVKLGALQPGTYSFACGMNMVSGTIVVK